MARGNNLTKADRAKGGKNSHGGGRRGKKGGRSEKKNQGLLGGLTEKVGEVFGK